MGDKKHSVTLSNEKCIGCTDCLKRCPTEAIRVRNGKAVINDDRCVDCGLCIKVCDQHAKKATTQSMSIIRKYEYKVAIPAPALYAQFRNQTDVNVILTGIKSLGFDEVFEVARAAEMVTEYTKKLLESKEFRKPIISSACPVVTRLICQRFPSLIDNILPVIAPVEAAAVAAKNYLEKNGIRRSEIGVFFISPCAAKNTYISSPIGVKKSEIDAVISMQDIYMQLRNKISRIENIETLASSGAKGIDWALSGGESKGLTIENSISVDGVENIIQVLEEVENGQLVDVDFIEGLACTGGCVGGPLAVANSFVAKNHLKKVEKKTQALENKRDIDFDESAIEFDFTEPLHDESAMRLDGDVTTALKKLEMIDEIYSRLPRIDCGSCGAPTCRALAEDITNSEANEEDCVFMLRRKVSELASVMVDLSTKLPQTRGRV